MGDVFDVVNYLNSLQDDATEINLDNKKLEYIPCLSRFIHLEILSCQLNRLTKIPPLNNSLIKLCCSWNQLTSLPQLNYKLKELICDHNQLTLLPDLIGNLLN